MAENAKWYVVHTYSGYENTVASTINKHVDNRNLRNLICEVSIPLETVTEITENGPKTIERKIFPGYVLVKMILTDETWHIIRNIRGVTGFVGSDLMGTGNKAIPLTDEEVTALGVEKHEITVGYNVGDTIRITSGPFSTYLGVVDEIDIEKEIVRVFISMGGREVPVDLELDCVEPIQED